MAIMHKLPGSFSSLSCAMNISLLLFFLLSLWVALRSVAKPGKWGMFCECIKKGSFRSETSLFGLFYVLIGAFFAVYHVPNSQEDDFDIEGQ